MAHSCSYWLLKTEPEVYSFHQLLKDKKTNWNGVRNFQARNHLKKIQTGDLALIYHSGDERAAVGIAEVIKAAYSDPDPEKKGDWVQIDIKPIRALPKAVSLSQMKASPQLLSLPLIKQSRLSVSPVNLEQYQFILKLGGL